MKSASFCCHPAFTICPISAPDSSTLVTCSNFFIFFNIFSRLQVSVSVLPAVETGKAANAAYSNVVEAVRGVLHTEGVAGLYKGVGAQVAQVVPVAGLSWVVFETAKRALQAEEEGEEDD